MKTVYNITVSILCTLGAIILEAMCLGKYLIPPILTIRYDIELVLFAVVFLVAQYFIFDRIDKNKIYDYIVGTIEIILSLFILFVLYFPNLFLNVKYYDCIGVTLVQLLIIISRVFFIRRRGQKAGGGQGDGSAVS